MQQVNCDQVNMMWNMWTTWYTNTMQWEQQSIDIQHNSKHHNANKKTNIKRNKQNKVFLLTQCLLPLGIYISLMEYLPPYKCAWEIEFLPLRMCTRVIKKWQNTSVYSLEYILPLFVRNRQRVKEKWGQEMKERTMIMMH